MCFKFITARTSGEEGEKRDQKSRKKEEEKRKQKRKGNLAVQKKVTRLLIQLCSQHSNKKDKKSCIPLA